MDEDDRAAAVELGEHWTENRVTEVVAVCICFDRDAVAAELVECEPEFVQGAVDVRERQRGEVAETVRVCPLDLGGLLVDPASQLPGGEVVPEVGAWRGDRQDGGIDTSVIHEGEVLVEAPARPPRHPIRTLVPCSPGGRDVMVRDEMGVHVDQSRRPAGRRLHRTGSGRGHRCCRHRGWTAASAITASGTRLAASATVLSSIVPP